MKAPNPFGPSESLISSPSHGYCDAFLVGNFLKVFDSGQSDVRSGNSMTTCCVMKGKGAGTRLLSFFRIPPFLALNIVGETSG